MQPLLLAIGLHFMLVNDIFSFSLPNRPFIFVRHGSTDWTEDSLNKGPQDLDLNKKGQEEALIAAKALKLIIQNDENDYTIISSTLKRALQTAQIISEKLNIPIMLNSGLQERYFGDFSLNCYSNIETIIPVDAESDDIFEQRIQSTVDAIFKSKKNTNKKIIIISHGEVFKYLSLLLTKKQQTLPRGGIVYFTPRQDVDSNWSLEKVTE
jgi:broad specificity phosphatase PhoE